MRWIVIFLLIFSISFADEDDNEDRLHIPKDLSFLHLYKEQKKELRKVLKEHRKKLKIVHEKEEKLEERLKKMFLKKDFDKNRFLEQNLELKKEIAKIEADFFEKIHSILDKKQREKFIDYIEEWEIE